MMPVGREGAPVLQMTRLDARCDTRRDDFGASQVGILVEERKSSRGFGECRIRKPEQWLFGSRIMLLYKVQACPTVKQHLVIK